MGSPAEWGALVDGGEVDGEDVTHVTSKEHRLGEEITASLEARMLGCGVSIGVEEAPRDGGSTASDRLVLTNVRSGDRLALTVGRLGRPVGIHLCPSCPSSPGAAPASWSLACCSGGQCAGRLVAVTVEEGKAPSSSSNIVLHLEGEPEGPFVQRLPLRARALEAILPHLAADEVLGCLPGAWEPAPRCEVVVSASEVADDGEATAAWPFMAWWPLLPADWRLA